MWSKGLIHTLQPPGGSSKESSGEKVSPEQAYENKQVQSTKGKESENKGGSLSSDNEVKEKSETGIDQDPDTGVILHPPSLVPYTAHSCIMYINRSNRTFNTYLFHVCLSAGRRALLATGRRALLSASGGSAATNTTTTAVSTTTPPPSAVSWDNTNHTHLLNHIRDSHIRDIGRPTHGVNHHLLSGELYPPFSGCLFPPSVGVY